jgi:hypothetical protein
MKRPLAVLVALVVLCGCKGSGSSNSADPFFGRTRVDPPRTGSVGGRMPGASHYASGQQAALAPAGANSAIRPDGPGPGVLPSSGLPDSPPGRRLLGGVPAAIPGSNPSDARSWVPAQPRTGPVVAPLSPPAANNYTPQNSGVSSPGTPGDTVSIPAAARSISDPPRQLTVPSATAGVAVTGPAGNSTTQARPLGAAVGAATSSQNTYYWGNTTGNRLAGRERYTQVLDPSLRSYTNPLRNAPAPLDATARPTAPAASPSAVPPSQSTPQPAGPTAPSTGSRPVNITELPAVQPAASR